MITVSHLTKRYGQNTAVSDLSFSVERGEILGFLGPNGAGKTTTMRILTGYLAPTSGTASVAGFDILDEPEEARKRIGYLPENPPLYNDMTVGSYLMFVARLKGVARSKARSHVADIVGRTGLGDVYRRLIANLSKGYKQRVGLAQALIGDPDVLILDEPTVGLDPKQIIEIRQLIKELGDRHTVILSSHILPEVSAVCSRVIIINHGRLVAMDTPDGLARAVKGGSRLQLRIKGPGEAVASLLRQIPGVDSVDITVAKDGITSLTAQTVANDEVREKVFLRMASAGYPILEMKSVDMTLEEVFVQLVTDESESQIPPASDGASEGSDTDSAESEASAASEDPTGAEGAVGADGTAVSGNTTQSNGKVG